MRQPNHGTLLDQIKDGCIVGAYLEKELVGTLKYMKWNGLPYYSIGALYIKPGLIPRYDFSNPDNPITYITDFILNSLENQGFYNWYYVRTLGKGYAKIQREGHDLLNQTELGYRYRRDVEEIVPAFTEPKFQLHSKLMGHRKWARPVMIIKCSLENQFRKHGDIFKTEIDFLNAEQNTTTYRFR